MLVLNSKLLVISLILKNRVLLLFLPPLACFSYNPLSSLICPLPHSTEYFTRILWLGECRKIYIEERPFVQPLSQIYIFHPSSKAKQLGVICLKVAYNYTFFSLSPPEREKGKKMDGFRSSINILIPYCHYAKRLTAPWSFSTSPKMINIHSLFICFHL